MGTEYEIIKVKPWLSLSEVPQYFPFSVRTAYNLVLDQKVRAKRSNIYTKKKKGKFIVWAADLVKIVQEMPDFKTVNPNKVTVGA